jgi:hypothetical protein
MLRAALRSQSSRQREGDGLRVEALDARHDPLCVNENLRLLEPNGAPRPMQGRPVGDFERRRRAAADAGHNRASTQTPSAKANEPARRSNPGPAELRVRRLRGSGMPDVGARTRCGASTTERPWKAACARRRPSALRARDRDARSHRMSPGRPGRRKARSIGSLSAQRADSPLHPPVGVGQVLGAARQLFGGFSTVSLARSVSAGR